MITKNTIFLNEDIKTKDELFTFIANQAVNLNISDKNIHIIKALSHRESEGTTGLSDNIAIPHGVSPKINKYGFLFIRTKKPIEDYLCLDDSKVQIVICMLIPKKEYSEDHVKKLQDISIILSKDENRDKIKKAKTKEEIIKILKVEKKVLPAKTAKIAIVKESNNKKIKVIGVTGCPVGIAHTDMAAEALLKWGKQNNFEVKIERQGARGTIDELTTQDVSEADFVMIASGKEIDKSRFVGKRLFEDKIGNALRDPGAFFKKGAIASIYGKKSNSARHNDETDIFQESAKDKSKFMKQLMAGVSYMIPFVITGGILIAISLGIGDGGGKYHNTTDPHSVWYAIFTIGAFGLQAMSFMLAGFIANAIGGKSAIAPALIVAWLAAVNDNTLYNYQTNQFGGFTAHPAAGGFFSAILIGFIVGYGVLYFNKIKWHKSLLVIVPIMITPILFTLLTWNLFAFILYLPMYYLSYGLSLGVKEMINNHVFFIAAAILGGMICLDMGGPINKIAFLFGVSMLTPGTPNYNPQVMGAIAASAAAGPFALASAHFICKYGFKSISKDEPNDIAYSAYIMGFLGISEGAIPFAVKYPKQLIISNVLAGVVASAMASIFLVTDTAAHCGFIVYIFGAVGRMSNGVAQTDYLFGLLYLLSSIVGAAFGAVLGSFLITKDFKRQQKGIKSDLEDSVINFGTKFKKVFENIKAKARKSPFVSAEQIIGKNIAKVQIYNQMVRQYA